MSDNHTPFTIDTEWDRLQSTDILDHRARLEAERRFDKMDQEYREFIEQYERDERREIRERWDNEPTMSPTEEIAWHVGNFALGGIIGYAIIWGASILGILVGLGFYVAGLYGYHLSAEMVAQLVSLVVVFLFCYFLSIFGRIGTFIGKMFFWIFVVSWAIQFFH